MAETLSHATFRGIDPALPANPFANQITAMPHARLPSLDDRVSFITVVRRRREVGFCCSYLGFMDDAAADLPLVPNVDYILMPPPYIEAADLKSPTTVQLMTSRSHRGGITDNLVGRHQAEYATCATATLSRYYLQTPAWWFVVEVSYVCMAELP